MSAVDEILGNLDINQLAQQVGADPADVQAAAAAALPALLGGLHANAQDPAGEASLTDALSQHTGDLATPPIDVSAVDTAEGAKISQHIFGAQQDQVVQQLGAVGGGASSGLIKKLLPILAPIVLSYLAQQLGKKGGAGGALGGALGGGVVGSILSEVLKGASQGTTTQAGHSAGSIITDVLGGLLGGGRR